MKGKIPQHIGIIMDGNGRWATSCGKKRIDGHKAGVERVRDVLDAAKEFDIKYLTLFAFSVENWKRPLLEVKALMSLLEFFLKKHADELTQKQIRFKTIGDISSLPKKVRTQLENLIEKTSSFSNNTLILALNYGSRQEVLKAVNECVKQNKPIENWEDFAQKLYTKDIPDPDLIIRTSGETRISNFLLMQAAYSEFYFTDLYWPDFTKEEFKKAINDFSSRERRFGKTTAQIKEKTK